MTAAELVERLERVKRSGDGWTARCPAHEDRNPSLSIREGDDGRVLLHCHAGCTAENVAAALGVEFRDLFPERESSNCGREIVATYDYRDQQGTLLFQVCRTAAKEFPQRRPDGTWGIGGIRRVLYRLPELRGAIEAGTAPIYVVEGEKDVHALEQAGAVATCNPMGAGKWRAEYAKQLEGAGRVVVIADDDEPGRRHALEVARSLQAAGLEATVALPAEGKDAADHLAAGLGLGDLIPLQEDDQADEPPHALEAVTLDEFVAVDEPGAESLLGEGGEAVIPENGDVMTYGDGGAGKTTLMIDLGCHLAAGDDWLGIAVPRPLRVLLIENEGPRPLFRTKLRRKRDAWEGSPIDDRLIVVQAPWARLRLNDERCRSQLAELIRDREVDVVICGPVTRSGMNDAGTLQEVRDFMLLIAETRRLAGRHVTFVLIHHENKGGKVSGAWEGSGDTLLHVQAQGHGRTRLHVQKARWASSYHGKTLQLVWTDGEGFRVDDEPELDDETLAEQIVAYIGENPGTGWSKVEKATRGVERERRRNVRDGLFAARRIVNVGRENGEDVLLDHCPERKTARLYLADDPTISHLRRGSGAVAAQAAPLWGEK